MSKNDPPKDPEHQEPSVAEESQPVEQLPPPPFQLDRELITYIERSRKPHKTKK